MIVETLPMMSKTEAYAYFHSELRLPRDYSAMAGQDLIVSLEWNSLHGWVWDDDISGWPHSPGKTLFMEQLRLAYAQSSPVRLILKYAKERYQPRPQLVGTVTVCDGQHFRLEFLPNDPRH
jgi:hypothetical protein